MSVKDNATYIIDFDSTLVRSESLDELASIALAQKHDKSVVMEELMHITNLGMTGELAFDESLRRRLRLFSATRAHVSILTKQLCDELTESVAQNLEWFQKNKDRIYVVSGGFAEYIIPVVSKLGIPQDRVLANRFIYDGEVICGFDETNPLCRPQGKVAQVAALKLTSPVIIIGDGYTDYEIKAHGQADEFWAFTENVSRPQVVQVADRNIRSFSMLNT